MKKTLTVIFILFILIGAGMMSAGNALGAQKVLHFGRGNWEVSMVPGGFLKLNRGGINADYAEENNKFNEKFTEKIGPYVFNSDSSVEVTERLLHNHHDLPAFTSVDAMLTDLDIIITPADFYGIEIDNVGRDIRWEAVGGELVIEDYTEYTFNRDFGGFSNSGNFVKVYCPESALGSVEIDNTSGSIRIYDVNIGGLSADTVSGGIYMMGCGIGSAECETTSGGIAIDNCDIGDSDLETVSGDIQIMNGSSAELDCVTQSGSIIVDSCQAWDIDLATVSGAIHCVLDAQPSDYNINFTTVTGSTWINGVKNSKGGMYAFNDAASRELYAETVGGDIEITFTK
jgi:DUF4097 and DUF4098 domain-containing protein YvlB